MFILHDLLKPLQEQFSKTPQGRKRRQWFAYTLLAVIIPFTSSITSDLLRSLQALFGFEIRSQRFYAFMGSPTIPWRALWKKMWGLIPSPATDGRILVALDDSINPKTGRKIFGCSKFYDHAAKKNRTSYPWAQCIVAAGLLKKIKSRWAWLPLDFRFYIRRKAILERSSNARRKDEVLPFASKMEQAAAMLKEIHAFYFRCCPRLSASSSFRLLATRSMRRDHLHTTFPHRFWIKRITVALSPTSSSGVRGAKPLSIVFDTGFASWGEALATRTATGKP